MTDDIVAFIRARLNEDEQVARTVGVPDIWRADSSWAAELLDPLPSQRQAFPGYMPMITQADLDHIARHDPARVLSEVEAKRRLLAMYVEDEYGYTRARIGDFETCSDSCPGQVMDHVLKLLALPYADHPDYHDEWRP